MVKLWIELRRRAGVSREELLDAVGPVDDAIAGVRRAVLNERLTAAEIDAFSEDRGWAPAGDAMLELWFDDVAAVEAAVGSLAGLVPSAADPAATTATVTREHVVFDHFPAGAPATATGTDRVKLVVQNQGRPDITQEEFLAHWAERHAPLVTETGPALGYRRYVQDHPLPSAALDAFTREQGWRSPPSGGVTEVWWDSRESQLEAFASDEGARASALMAEDEPRFVHPPAMTAFLARERVLGPAA